MAGKLFTHIETLAGITKDLLSPLKGNALKNLGQLNDAWLLTENGQISGFGSMADIPSNGAGILNSAKKIATASEDELVNSALLRLDEVMHWGTGAIEIKSGYGLVV